MLINPTINEINDLFKMHSINEEISEIQSLSGTTIWTYLSVEYGSEQALYSEIR